MALSINKVIYIGQTPSGRLGHLFTTPGQWATQALCGRWGWAYSNAWDGDTEATCSQCVKGARS